MRIRPVLAVLALALIVAPQAGARSVVDETDLQVAMTGSPASQALFPPKPYQDITWTLTVTNNGPLADTNVQVGDPIPARTAYVGYTTTTGSCTGGATLQCDVGTMQPGDVVTITLITTPDPTQEGTITNTATVAGDLPETVDANNTATASVQVHRPSGGGPRYCIAVHATPRLLLVGHRTTMHFTIEKVSKGMKTVTVSGVRVQIKGPRINLNTARSNAHGKIAQTFTPKRKGIVYLKPIVPRKVCKVVRIGVADGTVPPVTG